MKKENIADKLSNLVYKLSWKAARIDPALKDQKEYIESQIQQLEQETQNISYFELIELNYSPEQNNQVIELIHSHLNNKLFTTHLEQFERHFIDNGKEFKMTQWTDSEPLIVIFFEGLEKIKAIFNKNVFKLIESHFLNRKNKPFNNKQLCVVSQKMLYQDTRNLKIITYLLDEIKKLVSAF